MLAENLQRTSEMNFNKWLVFDLLNNTYELSSFSVEVDKRLHLLMKINKGFKLKLCDFQYVNKRYIYNVISKEEKMIILKALLKTKLKEN